MTTTISTPDLASYTREALLAHAREMGIRGISQLRKQDILRRITEAQKAIDDAPGEATVGAAGGSAVETADQATLRAPRKRGQDAARRTVRAPRRNSVQQPAQQAAQQAERQPVQQHTEQAGQQPGLQSSQPSIQPTAQHAAHGLTAEGSADTAPGGAAQAAAQSRTQAPSQNGTQAAPDRADLTGGILEVVDDSYGFLRGESLLPAPTDVYVPQPYIRNHDLRSGDYVIGSFRAPKSKEKYYALRDVVLINGADPEEARRRARFENLTAVFPHEKLILETEDPTELSGRVIDLVAPMGRGQRGLIVSPPKAGKTMLLQSIANGIATNHPDVHLMVVLIGERPEEVTEMKRTVIGEVVASTFDEPVEDHTRVAELGMERAKRLMEMGRDVVILLDSITRLTRAYNLEMPSTGRTLSGGIDPVALYPPKRFFGSARKAEEGGSLTIIATCLVDTGSRLDDVVFEEFKGTGNWEVRLDRKLAERRIYPSIDIAASSTRREELLLSGEELQRMWLLRRMMSVLAGSGGNSTEPTERLLDRLARTNSNTVFLENLTAAEA